MIQADPTKTIRDAIVSVLQNSSSPQSTNNIVEVILKQKVYDFKTEHPETVVNKALRRHCLDVLHNDARKEKYFKEGPKSHYQLLPEPIIQEIPGQNSSPTSIVETPTATFESGPNPYDDFQAEAVEAVVRDFKVTKNGRYLLCIPTGGGKTFTAIKSVRALTSNKIISENRSKVLWIAHRDELLKQAESTAEKHAIKHQLTDFDERFIFATNNTCKQILKEQHKDIGFIVIDEAHHAAASTYLTLFEYTEIPILGLTATPSRHDNQPLPFERESYSIGIPELIEKGILLKPNIITLPGGKYNVSSFDSYELEQLNCDPRNRKILSCIEENYEKFNKVVIFAATKQHGKDILKLLQNSSIANHYEHLSYIDGELNSYGKTRQDFIKAEKARKRSIVVNVQILTEGYDDPKIDCVFIAAPTKSKLFYMQAAGRALRINPEDSGKVAHIVEIVDELPNIRYRIDNRWLFSEISDWLEPEVVDYTYSNHTELLKLNQSIMDDYALSDLQLENLPTNGAGQIELLLFKCYNADQSLAHIALPLTKPERYAYIRLFNALSERLSTPKFRKQNSEAMLGAFKDLYEGELANSSNRSIIHNAMYNAGSNDAAVTSHNPWITYMTITKKTYNSQPESDIQEIEVETANLILDPNNPRFLTQHEEKIPIKDCIKPDVITKTRDKMLSTSKNSFNFRIDELKASIRTNGYRPVDRIFVRKIPGTDYFLVIEGNRRVTAIKELLDEEDLSAELRKSLERIKVAVIQGDYTEEELRHKITTILGIRHHGSLKKWSPFAQARNIHKHYLELLGDGNDFEWVDDDGGIGDRVAQALSISKEQVKARLKVYRAMEQIEIALEFEANAKMNQRYYSVISEVLNNKRKGLSDFLQFNEPSFTLTVEAIDRFNQLCYFSKPNRKDVDGNTSPINDPTQWRPLNQILSDEDPDKRESNLKKVIEDHRKPSEVWAERAEELNKLQWSAFFEKVEMTLAEVDIGRLSQLEKEQKERAKELVRTIKETIKTLENNG